VSLRRIAVFVKSRGRLAEHYLLALLRARWHDAGIEVVVSDDPRRRLAADLAMMHVDATYRPSGYDRLAKSFPGAINIGVRDISKRSISDHRLHRHSAYSGPVIVKTNGNYFGLLDLNGAKGAPLWRCWVRISEHAFPTRRLIRLHRTYPIYESTRHVPQSVWRDRRLVVERFLPEIRDGLYCLRTWTFLGSREKASLHLSREPIVKGANVVHREFIDDVPDEIREARRRLGFDYGKFDFVLHEGMPVLFDTNSTPACGREPTPPQSAIADELAAGVLEFAYRADAKPPLSLQPPAKLKLNEAKATSWAR
jgi:hypothetical protein